MKQYKIIPELVNKIPVISNNIANRLSIPKEMIQQFSHGYTVGYIEYLLTSINLTDEQLQQLSVLIENSERRPQSRGHDRAPPGAADCRKRQKPDRGL